MANHSKTMSHHGEHTAEHNENHIVPVRVYILVFLTLIVMTWVTAFVSTVDPSTGKCLGGDSPADCQFGDSARNGFRGPDFFWSDFYITKWFPITEHVKLRFDAQFFNVFNHPNFALPGNTLSGIPGNPGTQTGFGALTYTTSPPTGLLGVGLGGDSSPRMIAFQAHLEF